MASGRNLDLGFDELAFYFASDGGIEASDLAALMHQGVSER